MSRGRTKVLDKLYLHEGIPDGVDAARARALESAQLWTAAMARRPLVGSQSVAGRVDDERAGVNCCGVSEAFVASGGKQIDLFPRRAPCTCAI